MQPLDIAAVLANAKRPARTVELCLRGDLVADIEVATRDLAMANEAKDEEEVGRLTDLVLEHKQAMAQSLITVRLQAMVRADWIQMLSEHPPRIGNDTDEVLGFNPDGLYPAMIRQSWGEPEMTPAQLEQLLDELNDGQFSELAEAAYSVNTRGAVVPFGWRGSRPPLS
jgi:hypothetical protein